MLLSAVAVVSDPATTAVAVFMTTTWSGERCCSNFASSF